MNHLEHLFSVTQALGVSENSKGNNFKQAER